MADAASIISIGAMEIMASPNSLVPDKELRTVASRKARRKAMEERMLPRDVPKEAAPTFQQQQQQQHQQHQYRNREPPRMPFHPMSPLGRPPLGNPLDGRDRQNEERSERPRFRIVNSSNSSNPAEKARDDRDSQTRIPVIHDGERSNDQKSSYDDHIDTSAWRSSRRQSSSNSDDGKSDRSVDRNADRDVERRAERSKIKASLKNEKNERKRDDDDEDSSSEGSNDLVDGDLDARLDYLAARGAKPSSGFDKETASKHAKSMEFWRRKAFIDEKKLRDSAGNYICMAAELIEGICNVLKFEVFNTNNLARSIESAVTDGKFDTSISYYASMNGNGILNDPILNLVTTFGRIALKNNHDNKKADIAAGKKRSARPSSYGEPPSYMHGKGEDRNRRHKREKNKKRRKRSGSDTSSSKSSDPSESSDESSSSSSSDSDVRRRARRSKDKKGKKNDNKKERKEAKEVKEDRSSAASAASVRAPASRTPSSVAGGGFAQSTSNKNQKFSDAASYKSSASSVGSSRPGSSRPPLHPKPIKQENKGEKQCSSSTEEQATSPAVVQDPVTGTERPRLVWNGKDDVLKAVDNGIVSFSPALGRVVNIVKTNAENNKAMAEVEEQLEAPAGL